ELIAPRLRYRYSNSTIWNYLGQWQKGTLTVREGICKNNLSAPDDGEFSPAGAPGPFRFPWEGEALSRDSSAAPPWSRGAATAATTTPTPSRCGWPAAASSPESLWRERRPGLRGGQGQGPRPRPARDAHAPAGLRPHQADLPLPGPRFPPDRRPRPGGQGPAGVS